MDGTNDVLHAAALIVHAATAREDGEVHLERLSDREIDALLAALETMRHAVADESSRRRRTRIVPPLDITPAVTFLGYRVEKAPSDTGAALQTAYHLYAPSGSRLSLVRDANHPHILVAISPYSVHIVALQGYVRFTDRDGTLQPLVPDVPPPQGVEDVSKDEIIAALAASAHSQPNDEDEDGDWSEGWSHHLGCDVCGTAIGGDSFDNIWDGEDAARWAFACGWRIRDGHPICDTCQENTP